MSFESYNMKAKWGARVETVAALADRFSRMVDALEPLNPMLTSWEWGDSQEVWETEGRDGSYPFSTIRADLPAAIARNANTGGEREAIPDPFYGYLMMIMTTLTPPESNVNLAISASKGVRGGSWTSPFMNYADLKIGLEPDASLITFDLWRSAMLIICESWEATWAEGGPEDIRPHWSGFPVRVAWMNYVSPRFAPLITPPPDAMVERRPNGGLFLAATDETFQTANPAHMAAARAIEAALQPLNALPWPIDDPYL